MVRKVRQISKPLGRVKSKGDRIRRIDPEFVAEKLGAERIGDGPRLRGGAAALFGLRQELARRLVSTGGRPSLEGTERRQKIPMADEDWTALEELASDLSGEGLRPTAGQVASVLLHRVLEETIDKGVLRGSLRKEFDDQRTKKRKAADRI